MAKPVRKVWIDLENSPHVPFFLPIMEELKKLDYQVVLTARDCFQVCELADIAGLEYRKIGHHYGKNRIAKVLGLAIRVLQLTPLIFERDRCSAFHTVPDPQLCCRLYWEFVTLILRITSMRIIGSRAG